MLEVVKHSLGLCGEHHPSLLHISPFLVVISGYIAYIKLKIKTWKHKMN